MELKDLPDGVLEKYGTHDFQGLEKNGTKGFAGWRFGEIRNA